VEFRSVADVPTDAAARYAKQLLSHLGHKVAVQAIEGEPRGGRLVFAYGTATVIPGSDRLTLRAAAADTESWARGQPNHWLGYKTSSVAIWSGSGLAGQLSSNGGLMQSDDAVWVPRHASSSFALNRAGSLMHTA
jgi:hypothetical protein